MAKVIIGVVILAVGAWLILSGGKNKENVADNQNQDNSSETVVTNVESSVNEEPFEENTSLFDLIKKGGNYICDVSHDTEIGSSTGVAYIAGERVRGDFLSKVDVPGIVSMDIESHMISDGESVYTWTSLSNEGYKTPVVMAGEANTDTQTISFEDNLNYKCNPWDVDVTKFLIPTNITFKTSA